VRMAGKTREAIGFSLIFCFFCIKTKERAKAKPPQVRPGIRLRLTWNG